MSVQKIVIHRYNVDQPHPLLEVQNSSKSRFAEFAGGTAAECAVVCCCIPLSLVNLFVLAVYGVPKGLFRKALRRKRRRKVLKNVKADGDDESGRDRSSCDGVELLIHPMIGYDVTDGSDGSMGICIDAVEFELEDEMWKRFYGTGFWRSGSEKVD